MLACLYVWQQAAGNGVYVCVHVCLRAGSPQVMRGCYEANNSHAMAIWWQGPPKAVAKIICGLLTLHALTMTGDGAARCSFLSHRSCCRFNTSVRQRSDNLITLGDCNAPAVLPPPNLAPLLE